MPTYKRARARHASRPVRDIEPRRSGSRSRQHSARHNADLSTIAERRREDEATRAASCFAVRGSGRMISLRTRYFNYVCARRTATTPAAIARPAGPRSLPRRAESGSPFARVPWPALSRHTPVPENGRWTCRACIQRKRRGSRYLRMLLRSSRGVSLSFLSIFFFVFLFPFAEILS